MGTPGAFKKKGYPHTCFACSICSHENGIGREETPGRTGGAGDIEECPPEEGGTKARKGGGPWLSFLAMLSKKKKGWGGRRDPQ